MYKNLYRVPRMSSRDESEILIFIMQTSIPSMLVPDIRPIANLNLQKDPSIIMACKFAKY